MANVSTPSAGYLAGAEDRKLIADLSAGRNAMVAAGETYMPKYEAEEQKDYDARLRNAILEPIFADNLEFLVGKPFAKPVTLSDDVPVEISEFESNIDRCGNSVHQIAVDVFEEGLSNGYCGILADHPQKLPEGSTRKDELEAGHRPYIIHIAADDIIVAISEFVNGAEMYTHVRLREKKVVKDEFGEKVVNRVRVLEPGLFEIWEEQKVGNKSDWVKLDNEGGTTSLSYVPFRIFYAGKKNGTLEVKPPLMHVAHLNRAHWASEGDQRNIMQVARFPIFCATGFNPGAGADVKISPKTFMHSSDPAAKFFFAEHSGAAIAAGRQELLDIREAALRKTKSLLVRAPVAESGVSKQHDETKELSPIQRMVLRLANDMTTALGYLADFLDVAMDGKVNINSDFGNETSVETFGAVKDIYLAGVIGKERVIKEAMRRNILDQEVDPKIEVASAEDAAADILTNEI